MVMSNKVKLIIEFPDKVMPAVEAESVIIPAKKGDVTILSERAPSVFMTDFGVVQLLDDKAQPSERYFVSAGVADVAEATIHLMVSQAIAWGKITADEAQQRLQITENKADKMYYQMILDKLAHKNVRYKWA
jgi:F0F1-type ATP synthase epsilon subunit